MADAEHYEEGDYEEWGCDEAGHGSIRKGNFIADQNAMINWLTPEELERFSDAELVAQSALKALQALRHKVLTRELPGWQDQLPKDLDGRLPADQDAIAWATAKELMQPEEELHHKTLMKRLGEACAIRGQLQGLAIQRKGGPL